MTCCSICSRRPGYMFIILRSSLPFMCVHVITCKSKIFIYTFCWPTTSRHVSGKWHRSGTVQDLYSAVHMPIQRTNPKRHNPPTGGRETKNTQTKTTNNHRDTADPYGCRKHLTMDSKGKCGKHTYTSRSSNRKKRWSHNVQRQETQKMLRPLWVVRPGVSCWGLS